MKGRPPANSALLAAAVIGLGAGVFDVFSLGIQQRPNEAGRPRRAHPSPDSSRRKEIAEWNAAVEARRKAKKAAKR